MGLRLRKAEGLIEFVPKTVKVKLKLEAVSATVEVK